jgi:hypothetical protein
MSTSEPFTVTAKGGAGLGWKAASGPRFVAPARGVRLPRHLAGDQIALLRSHALTLPADGFFCNASAALIHELPIPLRLVNGNVVTAVPERQPHSRRNHVRGRRLNIVPSELTVVDGLPVTSAARTFVDLARDMSVPDLVALGDDALRRGLMTSDEVHAVLRRRIRYTGKAGARLAISLLNPRSESPQESRVRAHCVLWGFGVPEVQFEVFDEGGRFVARLDMAFPELRLALEYDGEFHATPERRDHDASRRTRLRALGWYVVELTAADVRRPQLLQDKISTAKGVQLSALVRARKG